METLVAFTNEWLRHRYSEAVKSTDQAKHRHDGESDNYSVLSRVVESEIIPRLMLLHPGFLVQEAWNADKPDAEQVAEFTKVLLAQDISAASEFFMMWMARGCSADRLFLDLLAPSAALLGRLWDEDLCDFVEVTTGVERLQILLSTFGTDGGSLLLDGERRVLLMGSPGEQHTFGLAIVEQFMRQAGWRVTSGLASSPQQICELVEQEWFDVVGLTLSCGSRIDPVAASVQLVRRHSRNRSIGVMVGGPVFLEHPEFVGRVGADASAVDAPTAVLLAQRLLKLGAKTGLKTGT